MLERHRRLLRTIVFVAAALTVAGTSAVIPSPIPQALSASGTLHVDPTRAAAIQLVSVAVESGTLVGLTFDARLDVGSDANGSVVSIVGTSAGSGLSLPGQSAPGTAHAQFGADCPSLPCTRTFAIVVTPTGPPPLEPVDLAWRLDAVAAFASSSSTGSGPAGRAVLTALAAASTEAIGVTPASGGPATGLSEADRYRAWTVRLHRDALTGDVDTAFSVAILRGTANQTAGPGFSDAGRKDRRVTDRRDPPVQLRVVRDGGNVASWVSDGPLVVPQFLLCRASRDPCDDALTIETAWADGRPETAFDAGWSLDIVTVVPSGSAPATTAAVETAAEAQLVVGRAEGSFEATGPTIRGESTIHATLSPSPIVSGPLGVVFFPSRGLVTARVTSVGPTPLPADAEILVSFVPRGYSDTLRPATGQIGLHPGEDGTFAFEPTLSCAADGTSGCSIDGSISASLISGSPNQTPDGIAVRIDWTIELGVGLGKAGSLEITVDSRASASPR
jgi:hypothetical protein